MSATILETPQAIDSTPPALSQTVRPKPRPVSLLKRCVFSLVPVSTLLIVSEMVARVLVPAPATGGRFQQIEQIIVYLGNKPGQSIFEPDAECFWRLRPNAVLPKEGGAHWGGRMSNSHGMRSREVTVADAMTRRRVLCLGDSSTFAFGVGIDDAWPNQLQGILDTQQPNTFEVLNAGIPGQSSYQGRQRITRELTKWQPEIAFITFGNNDGWRWDDCEDKSMGQKPSKKQSSAIWNHSRLVQSLVNWRDQRQQAKAASEQLAWAKQATSNYFDPNQKWTPRVSVDDFAENLRAMVGECREHGCEPVLVVWPDQRQLAGQPTWRPPYQAAMRDVAAELDAKCLDLVPPFEGAGEQGVRWFIPYDVVHVDPVGNRFVAQHVAPIVRKIELKRAKE